MVKWRRQWHPTPVLLPGKSHGRRSLVGCSPWGVAKSQARLRDFTFTFHLHSLEKEMATHSSVLAWRIPGTGEPSRQPSMGSHRVGHDWSDLAAAALWWNNFIIWPLFSKWEDKKNYPLKWLGDSEMQLELKCTLWLNNCHSINAVCLSLPRLNLFTGCTDHIPGLS